MVAAGLPALGMRYTKAALLIFGAGILLGLAVVAAELAGIERVASGVMALGLVLLPLGLFADIRGFAALRWIARRLSRGKRVAKRGHAGRVGARQRKAPPRAVPSRAPRRVRG